MRNDTDVLTALSDLGVDYANVWAVSAVGRRYNWTYEALRRLVKSGKVTRTTFTRPAGYGSTRFHAYTATRG